MASGISLANKSQLLFGFAVMVLLGSALLVPWLFIPSMAQTFQFDTARKLADAWLADRLRLGIEQPFNDPVDDQAASFRMRLAYVQDIDTATLSDEKEQDDIQQFLVDAYESIRDDEEQTEFTEVARQNGRRRYLFARPLRESDLQAIRDFTVSSYDVRPGDPGIVDPLRALLVIEIIESDNDVAASQVLQGRVYILAAGLTATLVAILLFYLILTKFILSPVRQLRRTAHKVQAGDLTIRSRITTGDEFELLSDAFNDMLDQVEQSQIQLKKLNETLDLKVSELSEANIGLYESNRLKSEFLANVSHELRTPLNSIIGFAEVLAEVAASDPAADPKRTRYLQNIMTSGRTLLEMINELLQMAKIEAGRMEVNVESTSVADLIEGIVSIMKQQADGKGIELRVQSGTHLPVIETDPGKLQQILHNFLSNAIKFTPQGGTVTLTADRVTRQDMKAGVRLGVSDTGPGIPYDMQDSIFEKFRQVDASHTRQHTGTGLGLAICRELAELLGATVSLVSEPGRGATFFIDLPMLYEPEQPQPLMAS